MTVSSTTNKATYSGNGTTTAFTVPFYFLEAADLQVILRSGATETVQTLTTQYTVTGAGVPSGGTVTMLTAPASGTTLTILRNVEATQETDLLPNDRLPAESLETALDKATMLIQQLDEEVGRSLRVPASDTAVSAQLPVASARASKLLSFDASGNPVATIGSNATTAVFTQAGAGAISRSVNDKLRDVVSVKDFGAVGDGATDDTAAIQAAFSSGAKGIHLGDGATYRTTDTLTVADQVHVDFGSSKIVYAGSRTKPALVFGSNVQSATESNLWNVWIESAVIDVSNDAFVGLKIYNAQRNRIDIHRINGFTHSVEFVSRGQGVTGVNMHARFIGTCKYALTTTCSGDFANNYINANSFYVEDWTNVVTMPGDSHGWFSRGIPGAYTLENQNGNRVHFHSIQPGAGSIGEVRNAAKLVDLAGLNLIVIDRIEAGRGHIGVISGPVGNGITAADAVVALNKFFVGLVTDGGGAIIKGLSETGSARLNVIEWTNDIRYGGQEVVIRDLPRLVKAYSSSNLMFTGPLHFTGGAGTPTLALSSGGITMAKDHIRMNTADRSIGFFVDIEGGETFQIWQDVKNGNYCALGVVPYDSSGARMSYPGGGAVPVIKADAVALYNRWSTDMGGAYISGGNGPEMTFTTHSSVKRLRVFVYGGTGHVRAFGLRRITQSQMPLTAFSGLETNPATHYVGGDPTSGEFGIYGRGDLALLDTASGSGLDAYQFTVGGYLCQAWAGTTAVALGELRHRVGNVYECVTAGTTGSTGPSGTGSGITDGSVVWNYLSTKAVATLV